VLVDPLFVGFAFGYLIYDGALRAIHRFPDELALGPYIKPYHIDPCTGEEAGYVVTLSGTGLAGCMGDSGITEKIRVHHPVKAVRSSADHLEPRQAPALRGVSPISLVQRRNSVWQN
jgi:hypothetical protein